MKISDDLISLATSKGIKAEIHLTPKFGEHITLIDMKSSHRRVITHSEDTAIRILNRLADGERLPVRKTNR